MDVGGSQIYAPRVSDTEQPAREPVALDAGARDYADPAISAYVVFGLNLGLPVLAILVFFVGWLRHMRRGRRAGRAQAEAKERSAAPTPGEAFIHGRVTSVDGDGPAARLTVTQYAFYVKSGKSSWKTVWTEQERKVQAQPFEVTTDAGNVIRVEPDEHVQLIDELVTHPPRDGRYRDKVAELVKGEEVYAFGDLASAAAGGAGYRDGATAWVLRPPRTSEPLQLSTRPLSDSAAHAAAARGLAILGLVVLILVVQGIAATYHAALIDGANEIATVVAHEQKHTDEEHYHHVLVELESGERETIAVSSHTDFDRLSPGAVTNVHVSRRLGLRITLDRGPRVHKSAAYIPAVLVVLAILLCGYAVARSRPWYEKGLLKDTEPGRVKSE